MNYTVKEIAEILEVSDRTVRRYLNSYYSIEQGTYSISDKMLEVLKDEYLDEAADIVVQEFTTAEYDEFYKRLSEYPILKDYITTILNELEYHKESSRNHSRQLDLILENIQQRNYIEAKDKKLDKL